MLMCMDMEGYVGMYRVVYGGVGRCRDGQGYVGLYMGCVGMYRDE